VALARASEAGKLGFRKHEKQKLAIFSVTWEGNGKNHGKFHVNFCQLDMVRIDKF